MVQWNYYHVNKKYEETAGVQCRTNAYFAIDWARCDLDYIFDQDDFSIKHLGITHALAVDELLLFFVLVGTKDIVSNYNTAILLITRTYSATIHIYLLLGKLKNWHRAQVQCLRVVPISFTLIWMKNSIFLFDPHSLTSGGNQTINGQAIMLQFSFTRIL